MASARWGSHAPAFEIVVQARSSAVRRVGAAVFRAMARQIVPDSTDIQRCASERH